MKQKSLQRPPTIRFTDSVLRTGFLIIILRFGGGGGGGCGGGGGGDFNISPNSKICPQYERRSGDGDWNCNCKGDFSAVSNLILILIILNCLSVVIW